MSLYNIPLTLATKESFDLSSLKKNVLLIVNTASKCGYTNKNNKELKILLDKYYSSGLRILLFPCNQFAFQEPGTAVCVLEKYQKMDERFLIFDKTYVNGGNTNDLYFYLKEKAPGVFGTKSIKWNFTKFIVGPEESIIQRFSPNESPLKLEETIKKLLLV